MSPIRLSRRGPNEKLMMFVFTALVAVLPLAGCGGGGGGGSAPGANDESLLDLWPNACVATMTEDYSVMRFDRPLFTVKTGERYIMANYDSFGSQVRAELFLLTEAGPKEFDVDPSEDGSLPFTSNCDVGEGETHLGVFKDTTFYVDEALTQEACTLPAGTSARSGGGFALVSDLDLGNPGAISVYQISMPGLADQCNGHGSAYVGVESVQVFGVYNILSPVQIYTGIPEED